MAKTCVLLSTVWKVVFADVIIRPSTSEVMTVKRLAASRIVPNVSPSCGRLGRGEMA